MAVNLAPNPIWQYEDAAGLPLNGGKLFFYVAGSSTKQNTYTDATGATPNANPIILNSLGEPATGIFFTAGQTYKVVLAPSTDTDPPASPIWTRDSIVGINDVTATASEWIAGPTPTFVSGTQFTLVGDQTSTFQVNRRVKATVTAGTVYGTISVSAFAALTTVTLLIDSGALDAGLSAVSYGLLAATSPSVPAIYAKSATNADITSLTAVTAISNLLRSYLAGLTMSTAGASTTLSVAAGVATDTTNVYQMVLAAISKTTSAWAVGSGNGGIDTGAIANSTWYHFYVIKRLDTGVVDVVFSTNATTPTLPTNYTIYRRIGSAKTNGSAQWTSFVQNGDNFQWLVPTNAINTTNPGTAAVSVTLNTPLGVIVQAWVAALLNNATTANIVAYLSDLATTDSASDGLAFFSLASGASLGSSIAGDFYINTNTAQQIRYRLQTSGAADSIRITTKGWIDTRGRNN